MQRYRDVLLDLSVYLSRGLFCFLPNQSSLAVARVKITKLHHIDQIPD